MKKIISLMLCLMLLCSATSVFAADISVLVNDSPVAFDVAPVAENGRTLVPMRAIFEALGATVQWNNQTQTATSVKDATTVQLKLGSESMFVNGTAKKLDVPAKAVNNRTLVPIRAISEAFGCDVAWNGELNRIHISEPMHFWELGIGEYSGSPYAVVNKNQPFFHIRNYTSKAFEMYLTPDNLGRCTYAMAMVGKETMPTEDRESISSVKPSGWQSKTYDSVPGKYLYNRCHLIGFQLTAENANKNNLITGTRYMNTEGMLPFENMIADYIAETGNHVLMRVTPVFRSNELVARGVLMEAKSFEDNGEGILFNVFCYNVQPGITINYTDGTSYENNNSSASQVVVVTDGYVLNTNSLKFHFPSCSAAKRISEKNLASSKKSRDELIASGYSPCGICKP